jgi:multifunctional beta-oxidation protein
VPFHETAALGTPDLGTGSFKNMTEKEWDQIVEVHLKGAFACTKAAWPIFRNQKFGRIINTASAAGLYGSCLFR